MIGGIIGFILLIVILYVTFIQQPIEFIKGVASGGNTSFEDEDLKKMKSLGVQFRAGEITATELNKELNKINTK